MKKKHNKFIAVLLILFLCLQIAVPASAEESKNTIKIYTAEDFLEFADNCSLDTWSKDKTVVLQADISLKGEEFKPIATFGGTFDGNGYTISEINLMEAMSPTGLFAVLQTGGVVKNLNVSGDVNPDGDACSVGGIVGENYGTISNCTYTGDVTGALYTGGICGVNASSGKIKNCQMAGVVAGDKMTGGIVGNNMGTISACQNESYVNTSNTGASMNITEVDLELSMDLNDLDSEGVSTTATDTGGIAGYSTGTLEKCTNSGTIGYQHVGYNVGGIIGRNSGYVNNCTNNAEIYGRKEVGGIAGQMEPYVVMTLSEDTLSKLKKQSEDLNSQINQMLNDMNSSVGTVTNRLNNIAGYLDSVAAAASNVSLQGSVSSSASGNVATESEGGVTVTNPEIEVGDGSLSISSGIEGENGAQAEGAVSASTQIEINTSFNQLSAAVNGMSGQMRLLNSEIAGFSGIVTSDLQAISNQVNSIFDTVYDAANGSDGDVISDTSDENIDAVTQGKVVSSKNHGAVNGDINVGGIAGSMSVEYELDPEDDVTSEISGTERKQYELKAIIQDCTNTGLVTAKKDYAGSICGRMNLGLITSSEGFGDTKSETGDYVGGIAGLASGKIQKSYAKCMLAGRNYIGGVTGAGITEDLSGSGSTVSGCYTFVEISEYEQYVGAISGKNAGGFSKNYFVSDELEGINHTSYAGKAEPVTYEKLLKVKNIPEEFKKLTLEFVIDGQVIETVKFDYGASFDEEVFPEIPEKEGSYGVWDIEELTNLCKDTTVTAVYREHTTALASEQTRKDGRSVFFVEGQFGEADEIKVSASDTDYMAVRSWIDRLKGRQLEEAWSIVVPEDGLKEHSLRYLPLNTNKARNYYLFMKNGDNWEKVEGEMIGTYLSFEAAGNELELATVSTYAVWWAWLLILGILIGIGAAGFFHLHKKKVPVLSKKVLSILIGFVILIVIIAAVFVNYMKKGADVYHLIQEYEKNSEISMELKAQANIGTEYMETDVSIDRMEVGEKKLICIEQIGIPLYFYEDVVFLENGKAYQINDLTPEYTELLNELVKLYQSLEISTAYNGDEKVHSISVKQEDAKEIIELLIPSAETELSDAQTLKVELVEKDGELKKVRFDSTGTVNDAEKTSIDVSAELTMNESLEENKNIPKPVLDAVKSDEYEVTGELSQDLFRLLFAWMNFEKEETVEMNWEIQADCGSVSVNENGNLETAKEESAKMPKELLEVLYQICLNGTFSCSSDEEISIYTLNLDAQSMKSLADTIAPKASEMEITYNSGSIQITVEGENFNRFKVIFDGKTKVLKEEIPVSFTADLTF